MFALQELVAALYQLIRQFEGQFASIARQILEDDIRADANQTPAVAGSTGGFTVVLHESASGKHNTGIVIASCLVTLVANPIFINH